MQVKNNELDENGLSNSNPNLENKNPKFKCPYCNKKIKTIVNLKTHITKVHFKYNYYCPYCNIEFSSLQLLQTHLISKSDELHKNLFYLVTKRFFHHINKELLFVNDDEPKPNFKFKCPYCNKKIKTIGNLKTHILSLHFRNNIYCPYCKEEFKSFYSLQWHLKYKRDDYHQNLYHLLRRKHFRFVKKELFQINNDEQTKE